MNLTIWLGVGTAILLISCIISYYNLVEEIQVDGRNTTNNYIGIVFAGVVLGVFWPILLIIWPAFVIIAAVVVPSFLIHYWAHRRQ